MKKYLLFIFIFIVCSFSVLGLTGSGTNIDPYIISSCDDFHNLNDNESYSNYIYIELLNDIDCTGFVDTRLINKTVTGLNLDGNGYTISNVKTSARNIFKQIDTTTTASIIKDVTFFKCTTMSIFLKINFVNNGDVINFYNITLNDFENNYYEYGLLSQDIYGNANNVVNVNELIYTNTTLYNHDSNGLFFDTSGNIDSVTLNIKRYYITDSIIIPTTYAYSSFISYYTSDTAIFETVNIDELYFDFNYTASGMNQGSLLGRNIDINNVNINNSLFMSDSWYNLNTVNDGLISAYGSDIDNLNVYNTVLLGNSQSDKITYSVETGTFESVYFDNEVNNFTQYSVIGKNNTELKTASTFENFSTDIWDLQNGEYPQLKWITSDAPVVYTIDCYGLNYNVYEYSNLTYNINCVTNNFFDNYTFNSNFNDVNLISNLTLSGTIYNFSDDNISLHICIDDGLCKDYNLTVSLITDNIKPTCNALESMTIYKNESFNLNLNCSDKYTNITFKFYSFPSYINKTYNVNNSEFDSFIPINAPNNDFTLYVNVTDSRDNYNIYSKFYLVSSAATNQTFYQTEEMNTSTSIIFIGILFFSLALFVLAIQGNAPILAIFSGIMFIFLSIPLIAYSLIITTVLVLFGVLVLSYGITLAKNN